jgi:hypothetical protein
VAQAQKLGTPVQLIQQHMHTETQERYNYNVAMEIAIGVRSDRRAVRGVLHGGRTARGRRGWGHTRHRSRGRAPEPHTCPKSCCDAKTSPRPERRLRVGSGGVRGSCGGAAGSVEGRREGAGGAKRERGAGRRQKRKSGHRPTRAECGARTHDLEIMRLTRCQLRQSRFHTALRGEKQRSDADVVRC